MPMDLQRFVIVFHPIPFMFSLQTWGLPGFR